MRNFFVVCTALVLVFLTIPFKGSAVSTGALVKSPSSAAVYYVAVGKRYAFPNQKIFFSWYQNFSGVTTITDTELASLPLAGVVTYRPGSRLIKVATDPKTYAVSRYGVLRWVKTEAVAAQLYGSEWNKKVDDLSDAFFSQYKEGSAITTVSDFSVQSELAITVISQNIQGIDDVPPNNTPHVGSCTVFPVDNAWNTDVSKFSVHPKSATFLNAIGLTKTVHPDFGETLSYGIPFTLVSGAQAKVPITFTDYADESDPGPYPIPANAKVESGSDAHVVVVNTGECKLYELYAASKNMSGTGWSAASGAVWDLTSNKTRPYNWTSADAAGLPIYPGLVKYDEVAAGHIDHAIRFTASQTQNGFILPATHAAGSNNTNYPPMGLRVRLKASYDISKYTGQARIILEAMKKYGMILADNGSSWFFSGTSDSRWNDDELNQLKSVPGSAFEAVDTGSIIVGE